MKLKLLIILCLYNINLFAQDLDNSKKQTTCQSVHTIQTDTLAKDWYDKMKSTMGKKFHDSDIPRFIIKDRKDKFIFGIGGRVAMNLYYSATGLDYPDMIVNDISTSDDKKNDVYNLSLASTRLFFKVMGETKLGILDAYIETDFKSGNNVLRLRQAYISLGNFKLGQSWSSYADPETQSTIDPEGPVSIANRRVPNLSYMYTFKNKIRLSLALEYSQKVSATTTTQGPDKISVDKVKQGYPDTPISFMWDNSRWHIFTSANMRYFDYKKYDFKYFGYSFMFSGNVDFFSNDRFKHTFYWNGTYNDGMPDTIQDLDGVGLNILVDPLKNKAYTISSYGFLAGYAFKWLINNEFNICYSYCGVNNTNFLCDGIYKSGQYLVINYIRSLFKYGTVGIEGVCGYKTEVLGSTGLDYKLNILLRYNF